jgi:Ala-tRNA(Pro) deacylase
MEISEKVDQFLKSSGSHYRVVRHRTAFTCQETAAEAHLPGSELAKVVFVELDGQPAMVVLPAPRYVDLDLLRRLSGANQAHIMSERDFVARFPDCDPGSEPPLGRLYGVQVYMDESMSKQPLVAFKAGSHEAVIEMPLDEFLRINPPTATGPLSTDVKKRF